MKRTLICLLSLALILAAFSGCARKESDYRADKELAAGPAVTLTLVGQTPSFKPMEDVIAAFSRLYPNCTIEYEYLQDYDESLLTRLQNNDSVDLFMTNNITADSPRRPYALELLGQSDRLSLADTYEGLRRNFTFSENGADALYAVPTGGEVRGLYVNTTLLSSLGLAVPENYAGLLDCCAALKAAGYIPLQGNPGTFGQMLMYPYVCSLIANADDRQAIYDRVNRCDAGVSELFRAPMSRLYELVADGYYNYKYVENTYQAFTDGQNETAARSFLNIVDANGTAVKKDDVGQVAFMPGTMSFKSELDQMRGDYHSAIDYRFILAPVGDAGGYAYLSPATGIAVNRGSANTAWALEFLNYFFSRDVNRGFAAAQNIIPNTADALRTITDTFRIDDSRVCQLGEVTFDYVFYDVVKPVLTDVSKANNPKYMQSDGSMYGLEHYMAALEDGFAAQRK